ncbi:MAG: hypothetical protein BWK76_16975 [Desulfobulbaceae bacterium A2]|nr:MAG: hypothetical protein BWK76_16975 [Desulfobulbaceae bacterium A2]
MESLLAALQGFLTTGSVPAVALAFVGGLLASLTPCVYPLIPITIGVIGGSNLGGSRWRGLSLSLCHVAGLAVTYTVMGVFAALSGHFFGEIATNALTFVFIGNLVLLLGLAMLDVFSLPTIAPRLLGRVRGYPGVFVAGLAAGLVAGPCTAPVLGVLLAYVASQGSLLLGGAALFSFACGMGMLLVLAGTFSGLLATLPRSGLWLVRIKKVLGLAMLALAEYFFLQAGRALLW